MSGHGAVTAVVHRDLKRMQPLVQAGGGGNRRPTPASVNSSPGLPLAVGHLPLDPPGSGRCRLPGPGPGPAGRFLPWALLCLVCWCEAFGSVAAEANGTSTQAGMRATATLDCSPRVVPRLNVWPGLPPALYGGPNTDTANAVTTASDGDILVAGSTQSFGAGNNDVLVTRLDGGTGTVVWARTWGTASTEDGTAVAVAPNGDVVVAGFTIPGTFGDMVVLRLDGGNGTVLWARTWGGTGDDRASAVAVAPNGDVVVAGYTGSFGARGGQDGVVLRLDGGSGSVVWARTWGGAYSDSLRAVSLVANGDVVAAGSINSASSGDALVLRLRGDNGTEVWARTWGDTGLDVASAIAVAANGDVLFAGYTSNNGAGNSDAFVTRVDGGSASLVWARRWTTTICIVSGLAVAPNGDVLAVGNVMIGLGNPADVFLQRLAGSNGVLVWGRRFGTTTVSTSETGSAVTIAANGSVILVGQTGASIGTQSFSALVLQVLGADTASPTFPLLGNLLTVTNLTSTFGGPSGTAAFLTPTGTAGTTLTNGTVASLLAGSNVVQSVSRTFLGFSIGTPSLQVSPLSVGCQCENSVIPLG